MTDSQLEPTATNTRWEIVPAALCILFGSLTALGSIGSLALFLAGLSHPRHASQSPSQFVFGLILMTVVAIGIGFTGRCWWRKQWRVAILGTVVCYLLGVFAASHAWSQMGP